MEDVWQVQEAKNRLSELLDKALSEGPQVITRHGKPVVQVIALDERAPYGAAASAAEADLLDFLLNAPKSGLPEGLPTMPRSTKSRKPIFGES
jgi:antitoxin Phd